MSEVTRELAEKVLSADERNIIQKVTAGEPLSGSQREIFERLRLRGDVKEELETSREAAIMRLYARGATLTKDQAAVLAKIIPSGSAAAARVTGSTYRKTLAAYAAEIGITGKDPTRKLKRWIERGRENEDGTPRETPDYPPFDEPSRLAQWYRDNMGWKVPEYLLRIEDGGSQSATPGNNAGKPSTSQQPPNGNAPPGQTQGQPMEFRSGVDLPTASIVQSLRDLFDAYSREMVRALKDGQITEADRIERKLSAVSDKLRSWEITHTKLQEQRGDTLRKVELGSELSDMFTVSAASFYNQILRLLEEHAPQMPSSERRAIARTRRDACFAHLKKTRWREAWNPPAIPDEPLAA